MTIAITDAMTTLAEAEVRFQLTRSEDETVFPEWQLPLPDLTPTEQGALAEVRRRYLYQRSQGQLLEGMVILLMVAPLLAIAGVYDPPFRVRSEASVQLTLTDEEEVLQGRIDVLVLLDRFWVVVVKSKKTALSVWVALPQALTYLMANPLPEQPSFAMITNGDEFLFVKLVQQPQGYYALSRVFTPFTSHREFETTLQVLKRIGEVMLAS